jgi:hypothetical protein
MKSPTYSNNNPAIRWEVTEGSLHYGEFIMKQVVFESFNITDCYSWIKAKQEGLLEI